MIYDVYKTYKHMEEHTPNVNNTYRFPPKGHQVPKLAEDDEVDQDTLDPGAEDA